jgi:hypothetical protein
MEYCSTLVKHPIRQNYWNFMFVKETNMRSSRRTDHVLLISLNCVEKVKIFIDCPEICYNYFMNTFPIFIDAIGWIGAVLVLVAYGLLSIKWMDGNAFSYQALNVAGAVMLVINSYYMGAYPSVGVNAAWVGIAAITLFRDWWRGPAATYKKVTSQLTKRVALQKTAIQRIKLPTFKHATKSASRPSGN